MIRKIKLYIALVAVLLSASSCLDKYPQDAIPQDDAIKTVSDVRQALIGIYAQFKNSSLYSGYLTLLPDIQTDQVYAVKGYTNVYGDVWRNEILAINKQVEYVYGGLYAVIGRCNFVLDNMAGVERGKFPGEHQQLLGCFIFFLKNRPAVEAATSDDEQLDKLDNYKGHIYFARALAYSELLKCFCKAYDSDEEAANELGVVLQSSYVNPGPVKRASLKDSYQFVLDDLAKAAEYLAADDDDTAVIYNSAYFTVGTVNALYARMYLYMQKWEKAVEYATKVIDSKKYALADATKNSYSVTYNDFAYMWQYDNSTEIIWKVMFEVNSYGGALGTVFLNYDYTSYKPDYVPAKWVLDAYANADLRYNAYFGSVTTGFSHALTWPLLIKYMGNQDFISQRVLCVSMPKPFRLAEQYLIRAEAYCRMGTAYYGKAGIDISTLRMARYSSYGGSTTLTEENWFKTVSEERMKELFMEGFRLNDLKRWHEGFERKEQTSTVSPGNTLKLEKDDPRFVWPIPQHELDAPGVDLMPNESNK